MRIRSPAQTDVGAIARILDEPELFPAEILEQMIEPFFDDPSGMERWLVGEVDGRGVIGFCYFHAEPRTDRTWNILAIGLRASEQGHGYGEALVGAVKHALSTERVLIIDTSGLEEYAGSRAFYESPGYEREAVIRDYWAAVDDKVTRRKAL